MSPSSNKKEISEFKLERRERLQLLKALAHGIKEEYPFKGVYHIDWHNKNLQSVGGFWVTPESTLTSDKQALYDYLLKQPDDPDSKESFRGQKGFFSAPADIPKKHRIIDGLDIYKNPDWDGGVFMQKVDESLPNAIERTINTYFRLIGNYPEKLVNKYINILDNDLIPELLSILGSLNSLSNIKRDIRNFLSSTAIEQHQHTILPHGGYEKSDQKGFAVGDLWDSLLLNNFPSPCNNQNPLNLYDYLNNNILEHFNISKDQLIEVKNRPTNLPRHFLYDTLIRIFHSTASFWLPENPVTKSYFKILRSRFVYSVIEMIEAREPEDDSLKNKFPKRENLPGFVKDADIPHQLLKHLK